MDPILKNAPKIMNPTGRSNAYFITSIGEKSYHNYYNAHNNAFFSDYGNENVGPQVCYFSRLAKRGGSDWDWVKNDYCSTQNYLEPHFRWYFKKVENDDTFYILDIGGSFLRINYNFGINKYFAYTAHNDWTEDINPTTFQNFDLKNAAKIFAEYGLATIKKN